MVKILDNNYIFGFRYMDLTDEEKEKLRVSCKVAKKLDKLENLNQDRGLSDSDDEIDGNEQGM